MTCSYCQCDLLISSSKLESKIDTPVVESVMTLLCTNTECVIYAGTDLNNPKNIAKVIRRVANGV